ncbi:MAG TPA: sugar phosphate isomerase/epimerase [Chitinophagaceae bacterium]|jgi:sugar phosphate isomerase/epimerase|nr:sugar phosphate isomerase/epimerase [Chitinophagaceae bacterium]
MHSSRRKFIKDGTMALASVSLISKSLFEAEKQKTITGIQLYSVRDDMKKDPQGTLKQISEMGYKYVEHADYVDRKFYGFSAPEFKKLLSGLGLQMKSGHTVMGRDAWDEGKNDFTDKWKYTVEDAAVMEQEYVISPWLDESYRKDVDGLKRFLAVFNKSGELCKKSGMKFGYHNHDFEFNTKIDGVMLYDIILKETDPNLVIQQMDMGNMYSAGGRPLELLKQYPGRFKSFHVKDEIKTEKGSNREYESTILGMGIMQVKQVIDLAKKIGGTTHFIIEQESYQGKTPLECVKQDLQIMKKWGY